MPINGTVFLSENFVMKINLARTSQQKAHRVQQIDDFVLDGILSYLSRIVCPTH